MIIIKNACFQRPAHTPVIFYCTLRRHFKGKVYQHPHISCLWWIILSFFIISSMAPVLCHFSLMIDNMKTSLYTRFVVLTSKRKGCFVYFREDFPPLHSKTLMVETDFHKTACTRMQYLNNF